MVTKTIIVTREVEKTTCDECGSVDSSDNWMYSCDACGKDICEKCKKEIEFSNHTYLTLCENCMTRDFSEYKKIKQEIIKLEEQVNSKMDELDAILEKMKQE